MELLTGERFLTWLAGIGVGFDPRRPEAECLNFIPPRDEFASSWPLPLDPHTWPYFIASIVKAIDYWAVGYLWPQLGRWPKPKASSTYNEGVRDVVFRGAGIPEGWAGAVQFKREEGDAIVAALFVSLAFGWCLDDDLYFVPDHGRQIIRASHHDVVNVTCLDEAGAQAVVKYMNEEDYRVAGKGMEGEEGCQAPLLVEKPGPFGRGKSITE